VTTQPSHFNYIQKAKGGTKPVKNLGWLLRNTAKVTKLNVGADPIGDPNAAVLTAKLDNGDMFVSRFASREVLLNWIQRRSLKGLYTPK
jgi:hypothetical protein